MMYPCVRWPWPGPRNLSVRSLRNDRSVLVGVAVRLERGWLLASPLRLPSRSFWQIWFFGRRDLPRPGRHLTRPVLKHGPRSLTHARVRRQKTRGRSESEGAARQSLGRISPLRESARPAPPDATVMVGGSLSACAGTRKMVNYARAGRSQRKLWWRTAAVLTCKSIVRPGYRGERLIEPSSSWFPPKFPLG